MPTSSSQSGESKVVIRPLRLSEARRAHGLFVDALTNHFDYFDEAYRRRVLGENTWGSMLRAVLHPRRVILVAKDGRRVIGYVIGSVPSDQHAQVYWLFVSPDYRGQNIGLALLSRILKVMRAQGATKASLLTHDHAKYYLRQGFKLIRKEHDGKIETYVLSYPLEP
jgi:ribosomal protein S18 acetylase RimI-like enzyme